MKKAVIYTRVSTEEQKLQGFSLQDQYDRLLKFCNSKGYEIVKHYQEDHSAKTFNRPEFKQFEKDVAEKIIKPDIFLCVRPDRFSRDFVGSINKIEELKGKGIKLETIDNHVEFTSPESILPFVINHVLPQIDNERRGLNTKRGLRQALKEGRWTSKAPIGYKNDKLTKLVRVDNRFSDIIKWAFETYSQGLYSVSEIWLLSAKKGLNMSKQNFHNMLSNTFYMGKIKISAWENEEEQIVEGMHEPLISEETFYKCKEILNGKKKPYVGKTNSSELPLKGFLVCPKCHKVMTGSGSTGNGGTYHYYHCQRKYGCNNSIKAKEANEEFINYLGSFKIDKNVLVLYHSILEDTFSKDENEREKDKEKINSQIESIDKRIKSLNEKFLDDLIIPTDYKEIKKELEERKNEMIMQHFNLSNIKTEYSKYISYSLTLLADLKKYYELASTTVKGKIISSIFPENLMFFEKQYRTNKTNEVFALISRLDKGLNENSLTKNVRLSSLAPKAGLEPATL